MKIPSLLSSRLHRASLTDAGVAGRRLHDGLAGLESPIPLGGLDDRQCQSILHGRQRIEELALGIYGPARGAYPVGYLYEGSVPNCLADILKWRTISLTPPLRAKGDTGRG